jgi:hypothetical protein
MSRRRLDRALTDVSQLLDGATELPLLPLSQVHQEGGINEGAPGVVIAGVEGNHHELQLRPGLGWVRLPHAVNSAASVGPASSRIGSEASGEGRGPC